MLGGTNAQFEDVWEPLPSQAICLLCVYKSSLPLFTGLLLPLHTIKPGRERDHVKWQEETSSFSPGLSSTLSLFTGFLLPLDAISISPGVNVLFTGLLLLLDAISFSPSLNSLTVHWSLVAS